MQLVGAFTVFPNGHCYVSQQINGFSKSFRLVTTCMKKIWFLKARDLVSKLNSFEAQVLFRFCLLSRKIKGPPLRGYKLINNNFFKKRSFQQYLFLDILTNPVRVTLTKRGIILGKNRLLILLFTYYSVKIKFAPFVKR